MLRTDTAHSDIVDDEDFQGQTEEHPFEHISCPSHPEYKLQLLCTKENFSPLLLCIKCLIDTETQRTVSGDDLVYIHDAINKGLSLDVSEGQMQSAKAKLEQKFLEFSSVDYLGVYEQHSNAQINKLEREIARIKESLDELQTQFKQLFSKQYRYLKNKQEELTTKIKEFIENQEHVDTLRTLNPEEITDVIRRLTNAKEYEKLVKSLYDRGSLNEGVVEGTMLKEVFGIIDDLKNKVYNLKNFKIEMSKLEGFKILAFSKD